MARTINSPGVEIREVDISNRTNIPTGTNVLVAGFAAQGPTDDLVNITSISELEQVYGVPTNAAERYFYYSAVQALQSNANLLVSRVPYGSGSGEGFANTYSALAFPVVPLSAASLSSTPLSSTVAFKDGTEFYVGAPTYLNLTEAEYDMISQGIVSWSTTSGIVSSNSTIGNAGIIVLNDAKVTIDEKFQGYYFALADNSNLDPASLYDDVINAYAWNNGSDFVTVPSSRLNFSLSSVNGSVSGYQPNSTSEIIESIPTFDIGNSEFSDTLIFSVFKLRPSVFSQDVLKLEQQLEEGYTASLDANRQIQSQNGGPAKSFFAQNVINNKSPNIKVLVNPNISSKSNWTDVNGNLSKRVRVYRDPANYATVSGENYTLRYARLSAISYMDFADNLYTFSVYLPQLSIGTGSKNIGSLPDKLNRILRKAENFELYPLDITVDGGLSTIWSSYKNVTLADASLSADGIFDDTLFFNLSADSTNNLYRTDGGTNIGQGGQDWLTIYNIFDTFARLTRKDHLHVSDPLRNILVQGADLKVEDAKYTYGQTTNFSQHVYWPLKNLYGSANSSYSTAYANWVKVYDSFSDTNVWVPFSGYAAALMVNTDRNFQPWFAPAGLTRGVVTGIQDIAVNPQQKERDLIEKVAINSLYFSPSDGYVTLSERTLQKKPSALDRIHVRRLFLVLEKATYQVSKYFVQEPNTTFTRARLVNALNPVFKLALDTQGLYDYLIVCDERNNTAQTIDNNELHVDIYLKPVRSAEYILINFFATRTDQNFNELV
jgi:hypothetical protein